MGGRGRGGPQKNGRGGVGIGARSSSSHSPRRAPGLTSRWLTPRLCSCATASAQSRMMPRATPSGQPATRGSRPSPPPPSPSATPRRCSLSRRRCSALVTPSRSRAARAARARVHRRKSPRAMEGGGGAADDEEEEEEGAGGGTPTAAAPRPPPPPATAALAAAAACCCSRSVIVGGRLRAMLGGPPLLPAGPPRSGPACVSGYGATGSKTESGASMQRRSSAPPSSSCAGRRKGTRVRRPSPLPPSHRPTHLHEEGAPTRRLRRAEQAREDWEEVQHDRAGRRRVAQR